MPRSDNPLELWGGVECTHNRIGDQYFSQLDRSGHAIRIEDLDRFASLGLRAIRYPVLWERIAPAGLAQADWCWPDARLQRLRVLDLRPIVGLVHHGSGPPHTSLADPDFAAKLADYASAVATRYPWVDRYTPVNEPLTTARFSGLYGFWYPHGREPTIFGKCLLNQCRAIVLSMRAIREVNPAAELIQTDDLNRTYSTRKLAYQARFQNELRWLAWDLLCGNIGPKHPLWAWLLRECGLHEAELLWFAENPCPPDLIGLNYYPTSERFLDERLERYPAQYHGGNGRHRYADIEASRALEQPSIGIAPLLHEVWERFRRPLAVTEVHIDAPREDQMRWFNEIWQAARQARRQGIDLRAVTAWALLGAYDWNCLVTACNGYYEPGPFDMRGPHPRPTAIAGLLKNVAETRELRHPVLAGPGWWRRSERFLCEPVSLPGFASELQTHNAQPILITGATGTLGRAFARLCRQRGLIYRLLCRQEMDIADTRSVEQVIEQYQPWAVINAAGYVRVDDAEREPALCYRENTLGPAVLASVCSKRGVQLLTFSSDLVFDGCQRSPYVETDPVAPLSIYGKTKAAAEQRVLDLFPESLVIRTSSFFGPWDEYNFIRMALSTLAKGMPFAAANDLTVSPTYVPDLVNASLDLLVDRESGVWHLTNGNPITWSELALRSATLAQVDPSRLEALNSTALCYAARRPSYSALTSQRGILLPNLENALSRFVESYRATASTAMRERPQEPVTAVLADSA